LKYNEFMNELHKQLEFEKELVIELASLGIHTESNFKVPGSDLTLDLYIKTPIRGLIEIKAGSFDLSIIDKRIEEFHEIHSKFNKSIWMFVIFFGSDRNIETLLNRYKQLPFQFIHVPESNHLQHIYCAKQIRRYIVQIALGLKQNEIKIREKENKEIINSINEINKHEKILIDKKEHTRHELQKLENILFEIQKSDFDVHEKEELLFKSEKLKYSIHENELSININKLKLLDYEKSLLNIEAELLSLEHQIRDLTDEHEQNLKTSSGLTEAFKSSFAGREINQLSEKQASNLEKTLFTSDSSFNILNIYEVAGEKFQHYFPHLKKWSLPMQLLETDKGWFIDATNKNHGATEWKVQQYNNCRITYSSGGELKPLWLQKDNVFNRQPIQKGMFKDVLPIFKDSLGPEKYALLEKEVLDFEEEYQSNHYTTAALRIGRTLEFIVYTLVKSWGIKTSVTSTVRLDKLDSNYKSLREKLITFYSGEYSSNEELKKAKNSLSKAIGHVQAPLNEISINLDEDEVYSTEKPISVRALLNYVRKEKIQQEDVRNAIEDLDNSKLIDKTYDARNQAAHANHSGLKKDFNKEDVKLMAEDLKEILFKLSNINATIIQTSEEK
jgi:hypothetical protein